MTSSGFHPWRWLAFACVALPCALSGARAADKSRNPRKAPPVVSTSIEALTASALKSVVVITHYGRDGREDGVGAGFVLSADGLIATSLHVIGEARPIAVQLPGGRRHEVTEVHAWDRKFDLAILRIDAKGLPALKLGDSDSLKQGAQVVALGNPLGLRHSVVQGVVSARREFDGREMIQLAIPIEPGNSGGPLLDLKGRVHGLLTLKSALSPNLGFATPANLLQTLLDQPNPVPMSRWLTIGALSPKEWTPLFGARWSQQAGGLRVEAAGRGFGGRALCLSQRQAPARPYEIAVRLKLDDESGAAGLVFGSDGGDRHYGFYPSAGQMRLTRFDGPDVYSWNILKQGPSPYYKPGDWNHLRVRVETNAIRCYVNGELAAESDADGLPDGQVGLAKFRDTRAEFRGFQVGVDLGPPAPPATLPEELSQRLEQSRGRPDPALARALASHAGSAFSALNERARELEQEAGRLRTLAGSVHRQAVQTELIKVLDAPEDEIDLLHAALLVARLDNAELEIEGYRQQVAGMAREISGRLPERADAATRLAALTKYLFAENGFHGSRSDYYNKANSYLNEVLDDREGLPITLSILFMELARRLEVPGVAGLPLPGHFMVKFTPREGAAQIIDVFNGGKAVTRTKAQELVIEATGDGFRDEDLRPAAKREIIVRVLRNLLGIAGRGGSVAEVLRYQDAIVSLLPDAPRERLERARLRLQTGDIAGGKEDLKRLLDQQPAELDLDGITRLYQSL